MINPKLHNQITNLTFSGFIITLGIVFGDLGTSPLYVMRAIVGGAAGEVNNDFIYGAVSCVIWTLTLQTTLKYVVIALRADNKGEGGVFSLYALVRRRNKWLFVAAIIGGAALLADGIITPAITVTSAIEGLEIINPELPVLPISLLIIAALFLIQRFGTRYIGKWFGPVMLLWFGMLAVLGFLQIIKFPLILNSFNPYYAYKLLAEYPQGFLLLGAVFLCTTGAETLYLDLGHCGRKNITVSWIFVKIALIISYLGQGAWVLMNNIRPESNSNPFYGVMPQWFLLPGILLATAAAIIASQAVISGSFTIISIAIKMNFWPKIKVNYPTDIQGQMYVPGINWLLWAACTTVILGFQKSSNMEAAYGLSITLDMLITTTLLTFHLFYNKRRSLFIIFGFLLVYLSIEGSFLFSNINKFYNGGWVTILIAGTLFTIMFIWYKGRIIKKRFFEFVKIDNYKKIILDLSRDESVPKYSTNLVYLTRADFKTDIETKIIYSIINKRPKRADTYWFIHVHIVDEPHTMEYNIETIIPNVIIRVEFRLGFKVEPRINLYFKQAIDELVENNEIDVISRYKSLKQHNIMGDFRFVVIDRIQNYDVDFSPYEQFIMDIYSILKRIGISDVKAFGLDTSNVEVEKVPLMMDSDTRKSLRRVY